jgi:hypothetical protein
MTDHTIKQQSTTLKSNERPSTQLGIGPQIRIKGNDTSI